MSEKMDALARALLSVKGVPKKHKDKIREVFIGLDD